VVTVTDGTITKQTTVTIHSITDFDIAQDLVFGVSDPGVNVDAWVCDDVNCYNRHLTSDAITGQWQADFAHVGPGDDEQDIIDIVRGTWADSSQNDYDGDSTMDGRNVPNPRFAVRANEERVEGWEWTDGSTVTIQIDHNGDGTPEISRTAAVGPAPWNPNEIRFEYDFRGQYDIQVGDVVSVTDGVILKSTIVTSLAFSAVNLASDTVAGAASPGVNVNIWACEPNEGPCHNRHLVANPTTGVWLADFAHVGVGSDEQTLADLVRGIWIDSEEFDADSDSTMYGYTVPNPRIEASRQNNWVNAREWPFGTLVTLEIDDLSNGLGGVDYTRTAVMQQAPWNPGDPNDIVGPFDMSGFTLEAGDVVTVSGVADGETVVKNLTVSILNFTSIDMATDTISGVATPGRDVYVCANRPFDCLERVATAAPVTGAWSVVYAPEYDIQVGSNGWSAEYDDDSDGTWYDWGITTPNIDAWFAEEHINAYNWPLGQVVTLEIDDPATPAAPDYTTTAIVDVAPWDPNQSVAEFNLGGVFDFEPGMVITVANSYFTKQLIVQPLFVTQMNTLTDVVTGLTTPNQSMWMWQQDSCCRRFMSDASGNWAVDFSVTGPDGEQILDVVPGTNGTVNVSDSDGDNTSLSWNAHGVIPSTWVGGVAIHSDRPVVAVGRPHLGSEVASYIGASAGNMAQYVPMLFKDAYGGSYDSALYVQNLANAPASVTIEFVSDSGAIVHTLTDTLAANASKGYWLPGLSGLGASFVGGARITADQAILAVGRPHIGGQVMTYNGQGIGATVAWLPMFFKNAFGNYNTALYVQNVTGSPASLTFEYLNLDGGVVCTKGDTLGANASKGYWSLGVTCDNGSLPSGFVGGVKVTSTQPILTVGRAHLGSQITTYNGFTGGATNAYVPMLFRKAFGGSYNAALYLQNVSGSSASVTIEYLDGAGNVAATQNIVLEAGAIGSIWLPGVVGLPDGFAGGARITSTQNIVAVGRPHLGSEITAYNGTPAGSLDAYLSMLFKNAYGAPYNAAFYVQNTSGDLANVDISFYDDAGVLSCIKSITLAGNATQGFWMPTTACAP
jgi:hypothetical protein